MRLTLQRAHRERDGTVAPLLRPLPGQIAVLAHQLPTRPPQRGSRHGRHRDEEHEQVPWRPDPVAEHHVRAIMVGVGAACL